MRDSFIDHATRAASKLGFAARIHVNTGEHAVILEASNAKGELFYITASQREIDMTDAALLPVHAAARVRSGLAGMKEGK